MAVITKTKWGRRNTDAEKSAVLAYLSQQVTAGITNGRSYVGPTAVVIPDPYIDPIDTFSDRTGIRYWTTQASAEAWTAFRNSQSPAPEIAEVIAGKFITVTLWGRDQTESERNSFQTFMDQQVIDGTTDGVNYTSSSLIVDPLGSHDEITETAATNFVLRVWNTQESATAWLALQNSCVPAPQSTELI